MDRGPTRALKCAANQPRCSRRRLVAKPPISASKATAAAMGVGNSVAVAVRGGCRGAAWRRCTSHARRRRRGRGLARRAARRLRRRTGCRLARCAGWRLRRGVGRGSAWRDAGCLRRGGGGCLARRGRRSLRNRIDTDRVDPEVETLAIVGFDEAQANRLPCVRSQVGSQRNVS